MGFHEELSLNLLNFRQWMCCVMKVVARYTEVTGTDWDDDRCSTCSSSSSDSEFDYYLDRRLRPAAPVTQPARVRHVGENFVYANGTAFYSPSQHVRSPSAGRVVAAGWGREPHRGRRRRKQTGKRCVVSWTPMTDNCYRWVTQKWSCPIRKS